ncbi:hypothetical protein ACFQVA_35510 [Actinomadura keratinilytica]
MGPRLGHGAHRPVARSRAPGPWQRPGRARQRRRGHRHPGPGPRLRARQRPAPTGPGCGSARSPTRTGPASSTTSPTTRPTSPPSSTANCRRPRRGTGAAAARRRDLIPDCTCPDPVRPCKHAAALCHRTARLLDQDPFVLLLLRGRGEDDLIDTLTRLSVTRAAPAPAGDETPDDEAGDPYRPPPLPGVRARDVLAAGPRPPVPPPPPVPAGHAAPPSYPSGHGGPDPLALDQLATQAAARAHALLATGRDPLAGLGHWADAVRIAAARPGSGLTSAARDLYARLARAAGRDVTDLHRAVAAWQLGGEAGLVALEEPWDPRPDPSTAPAPPCSPQATRACAPNATASPTRPGDRQLRLGRDGLWYGYISDPGREDWWPTATPGLDPVAVFGALPGGGA